MYSCACLRLVENYATLHMLYQVVLMYPSSHMKTILWFGNTGLIRWPILSSDLYNKDQLQILTIANCPMQTEDEQLRNQFILRHHCLYHVQSCSNFTTDCKITMFRSRSNFQWRDSLVWERDCATSSLSSIWSASGGESLSGMRQEGKTTLEWSNCYTRPVC